MRFNIAPTQEVPVVGRRAGRGPRLGTLRWGLIPSWAKDLSVGSKMINARSETLSEKPSFRKAFRERRCLVVATGFYEWRRGADGKKQAMYIRRPDARPFGFAGLWERWRSPSGTVVHSCAIITATAEGALASVHHRMPLVVQPEDRARWLDPDHRDLDGLRALLARSRDETLRPIEVSSRVNSVAHDGPENIAPC